MRALFHLLLRYNRTLRWSAIPLALYLLYFIPINLVLLTHAIPLLVSEGQGESFNLGYRFAWSWHPGAIELRHLDLNGTDANVSWNIQIERIRFRPVFKNLLKRELRITRLHGSEVQVQITPHTPERQAKYRANHPEQSGAQPDTPDPYRIHISHIELDPVRVTQIGSLRYQGRSRITGEFALTPGTRLHIPVSEWEITDGSVYAQEHELLKQIRAKTTVTIHSADLKRDSGSRIFRSMDIRHQLHAQLLHAQVLGAAFNSYRPLVFGRSDGTVDSHIEIKRGEFQPRSQVQADLRATEIVWAGASLTGVGHLNWEVTNSEKTQKNEAHLDFQLRNVLWAGKAAPAQPAPEPVMSSSQLSITGRTQELSLVEPFGDLELMAFVPQARIHSLTTLYRHLLKQSEPSPVEFKSKKSEVTLRGKIRPGVGKFSGQLTLASPDFEFTHDSGKTRLRSRLKTELRFSSSRYEQGDFDLDTVQLKFRKIRVVHSGEPEYSRDQWNLGWTFEPGTLRTRPEFQVRGTARLTMSDLAFPLRYLAPDSFWLSVGLSVYPMKQFLARIELDIDQQGALIKRISAQTNSGAIDGAADLRGDKSQARFYLGLFPLNLCLEKSKLATLQVSVTPSRERCLAWEEKRNSP